jgi:hypothetical protein
VRSKQGAALQVLHQHSHQSLPESSLAGKDKIKAANCLVPQAQHMGDTPL